MKQICIEVDREHLEAIEQAFVELGALSVSILDASNTPIFEPLSNDAPVWPRMILSALFATEVPIEELTQMLSGLLDRKINLEISNFADKDWIQALIDDFQPMRFGQRLWICPSWHRPRDYHAINVRLDPGLAFGTGTHPTTAMCLEWLDAHPPIGDDIIDYGCGSGVLAIAALKLGAKQAWAVDIDPQALLATKKNARQNQLGPAILNIVEPENLPKIKVDIVIANILARPLIEMRLRLTEVIKPGGKIILSGILSEQIEAVTKAYPEEIEWLSATTRDQWALLEGQRLKSLTEHTRIESNKQ